MSFPASPRLSQVNKVSEVEGLPNYKLVDFEWTLFTGAGFEIDRDGFAMITQISPGGPLQARGIPEGRGVGGGFGGGGVVWVWAMGSIYDSPPID